MTPILVAIYVHYVKCMKMYEKHDIMFMPMRICMKYFLKHAYVLEVLHEVECYVCMSMKCKEYVL